MKSEDRPIHLPELADPASTTEARLTKLNLAIAEGRLSIDQGQTLSRMLESQVRIVDLEKIQAVIELVRGGWTFEAAIAEVDRRGSAALESAQQQEH